MCKIKRKKSQLYAKKNKAGWPQQQMPITVGPGFLKKRNMLYTKVLFSN